MPSKLKTSDGSLVSFPATAALARIIDDTTTTLSAKRLSGVVDGDLAELRTRPWYAVDAAGREMLSRGIPVMWRRASVSLLGARVYDASLLRAGTREALAQFEALIPKMVTSGSQPVYPVMTLPIVYPSDAEIICVQWPTVAGFLEQVRRLWWPGWAVRRALSGEQPGPGEQSWSCQLQAEGRLHDVTLIASLDY